MNQATCVGESGLKNESHVNHARFHGRRFICSFIVGTVLISRVGAALGGDSSRTPTERLEPAIGSETALRQIPVSNLNLTLTGVVRGKADIALISVEGARDKPFTVGEAVAPGVKLMAVRSFRAVISHDGTLERLELSRRAGASSGSVSASQVPAPVSVPASVSVQPRLFKSGFVVAQVPAEAVLDMGNSRFSVKYSFINDQVQSGDLFANARMEPDTSGGFRITEIVPGSLYDALGLKDGDTISAINGKSHKSFAELMSLYEQRDSIKTVQIQVMRDGSLNDLHLEFQ